MNKLLTGSIGLVASEIVQQSNVNDIAGAITQIIIAVITIIEILHKNKTNKNETKNPN